MSRKLLAAVALFLAVLLPVRGFAAHFIAACNMSPTSSATAQQVMPCHEVANRSAPNNSDNKGATNETCLLQCSAVAASCAVPLLALTLQTPKFENASSQSLPTASCNYQSALVSRADKPPVL